MALDTLYSGITLEDLPKEGEVIHLEGYISKLDGGTLVITEMDTLRGGYCCVGTNRRAGN